MLTDTKHQQHKDNVWQRPLSANTVPTHPMPLQATSQATAVAGALRQACATQGHACSCCPVLTMHVWARHPAKGPPSLPAAAAWTTSITFPWAALGVSLFVAPLQVASPLGSLRVWGPADALQEGDTNKQRGRSAQQATSNSSQGKGDGCMLWQSADVAMPAAVLLCCNHRWHAVRTSTPAYLACWVPLASPSAALASLLA